MMSVLINKIADSKQSKPNGTWLRSFAEINNFQKESSQPFAERSPRELYGIAEAFIHGGQGGFTIDLIKSMESKASSVSDTLMAARYFLQLGLNFQAKRAVQEARRFCPCGSGDLVRIAIFSDLVDQFLRENINAVEEPGRASEAAKHLLKYARLSSPPNIQVKK